MLTIASVKTILFPNDAQKINFLVALQIVEKDPTQFITLFQTFLQTPEEQKNIFLSSLNITPSDLSQFDAAFERAITSAAERNLQLVFAPFLREATLEFLRASPNDMAVQLRSFGQTVYTGDLDGLTWDDFLTVQTLPRQHATYLEANALSALLGFNILITTRTNYCQPSGEVERTEITEARPENYNSNDPTLRFICEGNDDNENHVVTYTHWYIHDGGYYRTLPDGNCLYNGMAQWLRMLLRTEQPEQIAALYAQQSSFLEKPILTSADIAKYFPKQISATEMTDHALALQLVIDDQSVAVIRKELALLDASNTNAELLEGITKACQSLRDLCTKEPQYSSHNFKQLLNNLCTSKQLLSECYEPNRKNVWALFTITQYILNALHAPDLSYQKSNWTKEHYNQNISSLQKLATDLLDSDCNDFRAIGGSVIEMNFTKVALDPVRPAKTPKKRSQAIGLQGFCGSLCRYYLLPSLRILAFSLMIASILSLICFIALALLPKAAILLGPYLVACGINKALIALATFIGFSAPTSTTSVAIAGGLTSLAEFGLGYSLFKAHNQCNTSRTPHASRSHRPVGCCI